MEKDELKSIAEILALELPKGNTAPETALFTWHSDLRAWKCRNIHDKIALCSELRMSSWMCVESRLANLRLVRDRAEAAVARGISLLYAANHILFRKYVFYGPHLDFHLVRRSVVLHLSDVLNIDFATLYPLLQQVCDIKHFLYFAGIHDHDHIVSSRVELTKTKQLQQNLASVANEQMFTWESLRHIWKFYVTPHENYQGALTELALTVKQPILSIQHQFRNLEKLEKHIDKVLQEGVSLLPGADTDLWATFRQKHPAAASIDMTVRSGPHYQRLALIRALKRFFYISDIHDQLSVTQDLAVVSDTAPAKRDRRQSVSYSMSELQYMYLHRQQYQLDQPSTVSHVASQLKRECASVKHRMQELYKLERATNNYVSQEHVRLLPGQDFQLWQLFCQYGGDISEPILRQSIVGRVAQKLRRNVTDMRVRLDMLRSLKKYLLIANIYDSKLTTNLESLLQYITIPTEADSDIFDDNVSVTSLGAYSDKDCTMITPDWGSVIDMELLFDDVAMPNALHDEQYTLSNAKNSAHLDAMECDSISDVTVPSEPHESPFLIQPTTTENTTCANADNTKSANIKNTGPFTLEEDQLLWNNWNQQQPVNKKDVQRWNKTTAAQMHRANSVIHQRVNYLLRLEQQVNSIVSEGATLLPSSITELYDTYLQISGDTRVNCKQVDVTAAKRLQYALQPTYSVHIVLQEVKLVKWYLWLRNIHHDSTNSKHTSSENVICDEDEVSNDILAALAEDNIVTNGNRDVSDTATECSEASAGSGDLKTIGSKRSFSENNIICMGDKRTKYM